jgi:hypothetical protein
MIPGILITILTFPGVIVHEAAHMLFCRLRGVAVFDACFFRFGNVSGYVSHERVNDFSSLFLISMGPFFVNSLLCLLICLPASAPTRLFGHPDLLSYFLIWLGVSIGMHAFPSTGDAKNLWQAAKMGTRQGNVLAVVSFPLVVVIYIANLGRIFWLDYGYGIALGLYLPEEVLKRIA